MAYLPNDPDGLYQVTATLHLGFSPRNGGSLWGWSSAAKRESRASDCTPQQVTDFLIVTNLG